MAPGWMGPPCCDTWHRQGSPLEPSASVPSSERGSKVWRTQKNARASRSCPTLVACNAPKMRCGRLSRATEALGARVDAAHKGINTIFVQPLSTTRTSVQPIGVQLALAARIQEVVGAQADDSRCV